MTTAQAVAEVLTAASIQHFGVPPREIMILREKRMSESNEQIAFFQLLALNETRYPYLKWIHATMNGASASSKASAALRKRQGQKPGVSDICVPLPRKGYHGAFIEMKCGRGRPTSEQKEFLEFVDAQGYAKAIAYGADEAIEFLEGYLGVRLRR